MTEVQGDWRRKAITVPEEAEVWPPYANVTERCGVLMALAARDASPLLTALYENNDRTVARVLARCGVRPGTYNIEVDPRKGTVSIHVARGGPPHE
jgi:hypothetical protein